MDLFGSHFCSDYSSCGCNPISHITVQARAADATVDAVNMIFFVYLLFTIEIYFFFPFFTPFLTAGTTKILMLDLVVALDSVTHN